MKNKTIAICLALSALASAASAEDRTAPFTMSEDMISKEMTAESSATSSAYLPLIIMALLVALASRGGGSPMMYGTVMGSMGDDVLSDPGAPDSRNA